MLLTLWWYENAHENDATTKIEHRLSGTDQMFATIFVAFLPTTLSIVYLRRCTKGVNILHIYGTSQYLLKSFFELLFFKDANFSNICTESITHITNAFRKGKMAEMKDLCQLFLSLPHSHLNSLACDLKRVDFDSKFSSEPILNWQIPGLKLTSILGWKGIKLVLNLL